MRSPFPGIDPFLEAQGKWEDFHNKLLGDMERHLASVLPARYAVRLGERSYIDCVALDSDQTTTRTFQPDVGIKASQGVKNHGVGQVSVLESPAVDMVGLIEMEYRELFLEIYEVEPQLRLVTGIEVLSPSNKRPGTVGWYQYERKRQVFFQGQANLVEIDLLRGGRRHPLAGVWPDSPYYILMLRKAQAPNCKVWPAHYRQSLPPIPVPLAHPDGDVVLELQPLVDAVYIRSRYARELDYHAPVQPPFAAEDRMWLDEQLAKLSP